VVKFSGSLKDCASLDNCCICHLGEEVHLTALMRERYWATVHSFQWPRESPVLSKERT